MKLAVGFGTGGRSADWEAGIAFIHEAEQLGVDYAWTAETWGFDAATQAAFVAARTQSITVGTGVMQLLSRTPAMLGMTALSLDSMSGGRFALGLGASGPQVIEGWHGQPFERTIPRIRDAVAIARMVLRGERVLYKGDYYELPRPGGEGKALRAGVPPAQVPIYLATLGPKSLELTGEIADGWLGTSFMPEHADVFLDHIRRGAEKAGRGLEDIDIQVPAGVIEFSDDVEKLIEPRRAGLAFTLGAMGSREHNFYNAAYQRAGFADDAVAVQSLWLEGKREEAAARVPDELVLKTNLLGTPDMVRERLRLYRDAGVTTLRLQPAGETLSDRVQALGQVVELVREVEAEGAGAAR
ncbi:MAG: LLM class flavin-dependent oxidoreductase [Dehalococcoidia bacterium]|nr:LLM class flavin-dependent oxidoreductase [Dehalococcoidia bacterium]